MELVLNGDQPLMTAVIPTFASGTDALLIDAARMGFVSPLDVAGILAIAHQAASMGLPVTFTIPVDANVAAYLQRMDVLRGLPLKTRLIGRVASADRNVRRRLLEATPLDQDNAASVCERLGNLVMDYYGNMSAAAGTAVWQACGELVSNAVEHGSSPLGSFVAAQAYSGATTGVARFEFAVCDTGIGVLQHLRSNPHWAFLASDEPALKQAMMAGVSGTREERGHGLSDVIAGTQKHGTIRFEMRSGAGQIEVIGARDGAKTVASPRNDRTNGTWAWLQHEMPCDG
ncbi:hypothetical protein ABZS29_26790 [Kribbella sp. NPDC005582]|uniref:hypothetical protein n=1 Tax=Kribbella sp. NPDC005582 TaxID=3156893 RepID=UPI0033AA880B